VVALKERIARRGLHLVQTLLTTRSETLRASSGVVILAFGQWNFNHIMGAIAALAKRPLLVLREKAFAERGVLRAGYLTKVVKLSSQLRPEWLDSRDFRAVFEQWIREIKDARHVFLGYSTQATTVAKFTVVGSASPG
jgi:hypothetical protein